MKQGGYSNRSGDEPANSQGIGILKRGPNLVGKTGNAYGSVVHKEMDDWLYLQRCVCGRPWFVEVFPVLICEDGHWAKVEVRRA